MNESKEFSIEIFFSPVFLECWGKSFGSEKSEKFWPHMGFWPEHSTTQRSTTVEGLGKCGWVWYLIWELLLQSYEFWKKVWLKTQYRVKIFQIFHFQKHSPIILNIWVKKISNTSFTWVCCRGGLTWGVLYIKYNVYHHPLSGGRVTITTKWRILKIEWLNWSKKFRDPTKKIFQKGVVYMGSNGLWDRWVHWTRHRDVHTLPYWVLRFLSYELHFWRKM